MAELRTLRQLLRGSQGNFSRSYSVGQSLSIQPLPSYWHSPDRWTLPRHASDDGDDTSLADTLPRQAQQECVELLTLQALLRPCRQVRANGSGLGATDVRPAKCP